MYRFEFRGAGLVSMTLGLLLVAGLLFFSGLLWGASLAAEATSVAANEISVSVDSDAPQTEVSLPESETRRTRTTPQEKAEPRSAERRTTPPARRFPVRPLSMKTLASRLAYQPSSTRPAFNLAPARGVGARSAAPMLAFRRGQPVPETPYGRLIYEEAQRRQINPNLVAAVIWVESGFNPSAVSPKGAIGLMQVIPATAQRFGIDPDHLRDPAANLAAGTKYLSWLSEHYDGSIGLTLAAYNAGDGAVDRWGGIPPYGETRRYVRKVFSTLTTLGDKVSG